MNETEFLERLDRIRDIPTLPSIVLELNRLLQDPDTPVARVSQIIERDQAIALKILKLVNSAFYGVRSKVADIRSAVIMLGFNAVRNAIVSVSVIETFSRRLRLEGFDATDFWKHSLAVAVTAKALSARTRLNSPDNCFVGGILNDVGKVILAQYYPDLFAAVWNASREEGIAFHEAERGRTAAGHAAIGAHLAGRWQLPRGLVEAIRFHHDYRTELENAEFCLLIHVANLLVNSYDRNPDCVIDLAVLHPDARKFIMGTLQRAGDFYAELAEEIENAYAFFLSPGAAR